VLLHGSRGSGDVSNAQKTRGNLIRKGTGKTAVLLSRDRLRDVVTFQNPSIQKYFNQASLGCDEEYNLMMVNHRDR